MSDLVLRDTIQDDLQVFYRHQLDPVANRMAAFTVEDPADLDAFTTRWTKILNDDGSAKETITLDGEVVGHVLTYGQADELEVTYWIDPEHWGHGIATRALAEFLARHPVRPLFARVAKDNLGSLRVLHKCGFSIYGEDSGFSNARRETVEEFLLKLTS
ncbi:GNAT family N-acetyltransferase [Sphaerisporangium sp. NBC_01403]|uniref:GNAT family N-acetyltransferase n=1 Tax=Sphaerisporangium sp. NBC_01403 TaxID=2903599 RepID=UPI003249ED14